MTESNLGKLCHDERQKHTFGGPQSSFLTAAPLPKNDVKSWVGYRNKIKHLAFSVTKPSLLRAPLCGANKAKPI